MDKKQKKMFLSIVAILILIVLLIGFTFAKYYSVYEGAVSVQAAKWSFRVNGWNPVETEKLSLTRLASTTNINLEEGKIAPGYGGEIPIEIDATGSEVDVNYHIEVEESGNKPPNLVYRLRYENNTSSPEYSNLQDLFQLCMYGNILRTDENKVKKATLIIYWPYEISATSEQVQAADKVDTSIGEAEQYDYGFTLKVIGKQAIRG